MWADLDVVWHQAFAQAWEAVRYGSIGVGAVLSDPEGRIVAFSRNRVGENVAPPGELCGSTVAHAEMNVLAKVQFRSPRELTLTTTLQPCLQCSAAIRMGPVREVRVAGADPLWDGCHDFTSLSSWVARREAVPIDGPITGPVGAFGTVLSRFGLGLIPEVEDALRLAGHGGTVDLARRIEADGTLAELVAQPVDAAFIRLFDDLVIAASDPS
jgi:tRNA(Arg) A34 adenosine deaminase TadA